MPDILIVSSHTAPSSTAPINHQIYASRHGYRYLFDVTPYPLKKTFDQKLKTIIAHLEHTTWLMWIDDDAYIMDHNIKLEQFLPENDNCDLVFCNSPINDKGEWTFLNSGVCFIRNTAFTRKLFEEIINTPIETVKQWWEKEKYGKFTNGDQDQIVYQLVNQNALEEKLLIREYFAFNARPVDFATRPDEHFICHFCGFKDKILPIYKLRKKFNLNRFMLQSDTKEIEKNYKYSLFFQAQSSNIVATKILKRFLTKINRIVK
ncbi:hypothetical protein [Sodalis ligni]|uniref:Galactosyl transferase GMA12/MNN10 family protein n=1 Tax=Sodalis ligni TaxID=2697027 RepID=A0A4R1NJN0_9GAMM|nr:hypothetical protein [Sodalis ligni]TCL07347.1 galactosyl transferase GMA12/MNN10 family protein [Sodalis ligni]